MKNLQSKKAGLSANTLKIFAVATMTLDHIALVFINPDTVLWLIMRIIGRMTAPIFSFFIAEGFRYTRSRHKYIGRIAIFAVISQPFFTLMSMSTPGVTLNIMYTLVISLLILTIIENVGGYKKIPLLLILGMVSLLGDWHLYIPLWVVIFYAFKSFKVKALIFSAASIAFITLTDNVLQYSVLLAMIPLSLYNGKRGGSNDNKSKWLFYLYYPAHMAALVILKAIT
jgi:hypothetical protein